MKNKKIFAKTFLKALGVNNFVTHHEMILNNEIYKPFFQEFVEFLDGTVAVGRGLVMLFKSSGVPFDNNELKEKLKEFADA